MNVAKQSGSVDRGLYTLANLTSFLLKTDPTIVIFDKDELRPHLVEMLECGKMSMFPVKLHRRQSAESRSFIPFRFFATAGYQSGHVVTLWYAVTGAKNGFTWNV